MASTFLLVVLDHDEKVFSIHGPMSDDTQWNSRVVAAQKAGRQVNCSTPSGHDRPAVALSVRRQFGFKEIAAVALPASN